MARTIEQTLPRREHLIEGLQGIQHPQRVEPDADLHGWQTPLHGTDRTLRDSQPLGEGRHAVVARQPGIAQAVTQLQQHSRGFSNLLHKEDYIGKLAIN